MQARHLASSGLLGSLCCLPPLARAADTVETWDQGATDVEFYVGLDSEAEAHKTLYGEMVLGYGLTSGLSAYMGTVLQADQSLSSASSARYMGVFGTPLDTDHVDVDLLLDLLVVSDDDPFLHLTPSLELNYDSHPELAGWGLYLRAGLPIYGHEATEPNLSQGLEGEMGYHLDATLGAYLALHERHQLLLESAWTFMPVSTACETGSAGIRSGGMALGYNITLVPELEIITHAYVVPGTDQVATGFMLGGIASLL